MKVLVWQWGKRGAGPRVAVELAEGIRQVPGAEAALSLSTEAEIMQGPEPPRCELPVRTYSGLAGFLLRLAQAPLTIRALTRSIRTIGPDVAICAMPGPLDLVCLAALRRAGVPIVVVVHDADAHPGDGLPFQMTLQRLLTWRADALVALTGHVAERLREQKLAGMPDGGKKPGGGKPLFLASLPPFVFGPVPPPPGAHGGAFRLLSFGRLLPYKGLDLLAAALRRLNPLSARGGQGVVVRIVGNGPESPVLAELRAIPGVAVENRWVPEAEIGALLAWADAMVLSHREASQSGVAAAAIAARRWVVATAVGGLREQLQDEPLGILCEPDAESLAAALVGLIEQPPPLPPPPQTDIRMRWQATAEALVRNIADAGLVRCAEKAGGRRP